MPFSNRKFICGLLALHLFACAHGQITVTRLNSNQPIIERTMPPFGWTITGPSMLRIPDWIPVTKRADPNAKYYIYFAAHYDPYIKLAWSEKVEGPYHIFNPGKGVFHLEDYVQPGNLLISNHVASPDVLIDSTSYQFIMYFHAGVVTWDGDSIKEQMTVVAVSDFGLDFNEGLQDVLICPPYARVFSYNEELYALCKKGIYQAPDPVAPWKHDNGFSRKNKHLWKKVSDPFRWIPKQERHFALLMENDAMHVMYSRISSMPEHIEYSKIFLDKNIHFWKPSGPVDILYPEYEWEGISFEIKESETGADNQAHALRDPYLFLDADSLLYLLYTGAGEQSLGIARVDGLLGNRNSNMEMPCQCPDSLKIYPNPCPDGIIHLEGLNKRAIIEVYDASGSCIIHKKISNMHHHIITLPEKHGNTFFLHIIDASYTCWKQIILS